MMPDHSSGVETQRPAELLQAPTHINIIASNMELRIEAADCPKARGTKSHVTARNVFRLLVGQENVDRPSRRVDNTIGDWPITRRSNVRSPHSRVGRRQKSGGQIGQPMRIRAGVIVDIGHNLTRGSSQTSVASLAQTAIFRTDDGEAMFTGNARCPISRSIVDDDDLEVRIVQLQQTFETIVQGALPVVTTHDHRDTGKGQTWREWHFTVCLTYGSQGELRLPGDQHRRALPGVLVPLSPSPVSCHHPGRRYVVPTEGPPSRRVHAAVQHPAANAAV